MTEPTARYLRAAAGQAPAAGDTIPPGPIPVFPTPTPQRQLRLTINGREISVPEGSSLLQAAIEAGFEVPTLCYLETLTPVNVCRVCVVEVEGSRTLVPACSRKAEDGMAVKTDSERVRLSRRLVLEFLASATGLIVVALQIGYLPTLYGAYNRREILVTALDSRAGAPAWGPEILARHHLSEATASLPAMYAAWETLSADIAESHSSYPWLMGMRSPSPLNCWVISLLAVLDSAALYISLCPATVPTEARQCLRMGFVALRALARAMGIDVKDDPRPDDPIELTFEQFTKGVEHMRRAGFPLERSAEDAWPDFHGWRVNYESAAYHLADRLSAVPAAWSGKRKHMSKRDYVDVLARRPRHRTPTDPEGKRVLERQMTFSADAE